MKSSARKILQSNQLVQTNREESGKALQPSNGKEPKGFGSDAESNGNRNAFLVALQEALKISDYGLLSRLLEQTAGAALIGGVKAPNDWYYPAAALRAIGPKDELEGLVAAQIVATHSQGMEFLRRCVRQEQSNAGIDLNLNRALKLLRMFATLLERLDHHRGKGGQKMVVEHVHIYKGGQAIVGPVSQDKSGGPRRSDEEQD